MATGRGLLPENAVAGTRTGEGLGGSASRGGRHPRGQGHRMNTRSRRLADSPHRHVHGHAARSNRAIRRAGDNNLAVTRIELVMCGSFAA
jgi:hypothetical protein